MSFWARVRQSILARLAAGVLVIAGGWNASKDDFLRQFRPSTVDNMPVSTFPDGVPMAPRTGPMPDPVLPPRIEVPTGGHAPWPPPVPDVVPAPPPEISPSEPDIWFGERSAPRHPEIPSSQPNPWLAQELPPPPPQWRDVADRFRRQAGARLRSVEHMLDEYEQPVALAEDVLCLHLEHLVEEGRLPTGREYYEFLVDILRFEPPREVLEALAALRDLAQNISEAEDWLDVSRDLIIYARCDAPVMLSLGARPER